MKNNVLRTGRVPFVITFDTGAQETIYFNPNDPDLAEKLESLAARISEKAAGIEDVELTPEGEPVHASDMEKYRELRAIAYEEIDKTFNYGVSEKVFKHCSFFAKVEGKFFGEVFFEYIIPVIESELKKSRTKTNKHTAEFIK